MSMLLLGCGSPGVSWSPADLSNLGLWLRASPTDLFQDAGQTAPCSDGQSVYTWHDRSGAGRHAVQAFAPSRPTMAVTGGRDWVFFADDGLASIVSPWSPTSPNSEWFLRLKYAAPNPHAGIFSLGGTENDFNLLVESGSTVKVSRYGVSVSANTSPTLAADTAAILHVRGAGNAAWDAAWAGFVAKDGGTPEAVSLGYAESSGSTNLSPNIGGPTATLWVSDLIVTEGGLSSDDRQRVLDWLIAN